MAAIRPNQERAKWAMIMVGVILLMEIVSIISVSLTIFLLKKADSPEGISEEVAKNNDLREKIIIYTYMFLYYVSAFTFIRWFRRAYFNLHLIVVNLKFKESKAAYGWFIPIQNLFVPFRIMKELYNKTKNLLLYSSQEGVTLNNGDLTLWWTLWIFNSFFSQIINRISNKMDTIEEIMQISYGNIVGSFLGIFLALITIKIIYNYSKVEPLLNNLEDEIDQIGKDLKY